MQFYNEVPLKTGAASVYPYSKAVASKFFFKSRYDDEYCIARKFGDELWVPRAMTPPGAKDTTSNGTPEKFTCNIVAKGPEQQVVFDKMIELADNGESYICNAQTGFGKTVCALHTIAKYGKKTLIIVHKEDLLQQWASAAKKFLNLTSADIGIIQGDSCQVAGKKIVIGMIQSLAKEGKYPEHMLSQFGMVVFDEVHHVSANYFSQCVWALPAKIRIGLSATVNRNDGKSHVFLSHIGKVRIVANVLSLIPKILVLDTKWQVPRVTRRDAVTKIKEKVQLHHESGRTMHINKKMSFDINRNNLIVRMLLKAYKKGRHTVAFSSIIEHLDILYTLLLSSGVPKTDIAFYIGGKKYKSDRERAKVVPIVLATYQMTAEATDVVRWDTCILCHPMANIQQAIGRILRDWTDVEKEADPTLTKADPIVFDLVDIDSPIFEGYYSKRRKYYNSIGAEIKEM